MGQGDGCLGGEEAGKENLSGWKKIMNQYKYILNWSPISNPKRKQELKKKMSEQPENNKETLEWCVCHYHSSLEAEVQ